MTIIFIVKQYGNGYFIKELDSGLAETEAVAGWLAEEGEFLFFANVDLNV